MSQENPFIEAKKEFTNTRSYQRSCLFLNQIGGRVDECEFPTYLPTSYSDRPPLHAVWKRREELEKIDKLTKGEDPCAPPTLQSLMAEKRQMEAEIKEAEEVRKQYRTKHIATMGKTDDLCHKGSCDEILKEAKRLTQGRT